MHRSGTSLVARLLSLRGLELGPAEGLLPAIYFIFSRAGCDAAARAVAGARLPLTNEAERSTIREVAEARTAQVEVLR